MNRPESDTDDSIEARARRRVALKKSWLVHATVYVLVNGGLWLLGLMRAAEGGWGPPHLHFLPLWGWGLGLAIHGIVVLIRLGSEGMQARWVEKEIETLRRREGGRS